MPRFVVGLRPALSKRLTAPNTTTRVSADKDALVPHASKASILAKERESGSRNPTTTVTGRGMGGGAVNGGIGGQVDTASPKKPLSDWPVARFRATLLAQCARHA